MKKGILVFTDEKTLEHKKRDGSRRDNRYCYWETSRMPKEFVELIQPERLPFGEEFYNLIKKFPIYFAVNGIVRGYFIIDDLDEHTLIFDSDSWVEIKNGEKLKSSQGWRYYPK